MMMGDIEFLLDDEFIVTYFGQMVIYNEGQPIKVLEPDRAAELEAMKIYFDVDTPWCSMPK